MTIAAWNIVLNATIVVLLVGYGIWLRHIVKEQVNAKDATIETLNAAVKAQEGEIARLKGETAPALADAYQKMRTHADQMTADAAKLKADVEKLSVEKSRIQQSIPITRLLAESTGLKFASDELIKALDPYLSKPLTWQEAGLTQAKALASVIAVINNINSEHMVRSTKGLELVRELFSTHPQ